MIKEVSCLFRFIRPALEESTIWVKQGGMKNWWLGLESKIMFETPARSEGKRAENSGGSDLADALLESVSLGVE